MDMSIWAEVEGQVWGKGAWLRPEGGGTESQTEEAHLSGMLSRGRRTVIQVRKAPHGEALSCPIAGRPASKGTSFSIAPHVCMPSVWVLSTLLQIAET